MKRVDKTIGFLLDWLEDQYQQKILSGISSCVTEHNVNCFYGYTYNSNSSNSAE
jgi:DNA-binding LacI/PurR family transcriptional regulator